MRRVIVIDAAGAETRVAIVEDGRLVELMHERDDERRMVGDIYLGRQFFDSIGFHQQVDSCLVQSL